MKTTSEFVFGGQKATSYFISQKTDGRLSADFKILYFTVTSVRCHYNSMDDRLGTTEKFCISM